TDPHTGQRAQQLGGGERAQTHLKTFEFCKDSSAHRKAIPVERSLLVRSTGRGAERAPFRTFGHGSAGLRVLPGNRDTQVAFASHLLGERVHGYPEPECTL